MYRKSCESPRARAPTFGRLKKPLRKISFSMSDHGRTRLPSSFTWYGQLHPCGHGRPMRHSTRALALRGRSRQRIGLPSVVSVLLCVTNLCLHGSCCRFDTSACRVLKYSGSYASHAHARPRAASSTRTPPSSTSGFACTARSFATLRLTRPRLAHAPHACLACRRRPPSSRAPPSSRCPPPRCASNASAPPDACTGGSPC